MHFNLPLIINQGKKAKEITETAKAYSINKNKGVLSFAVTLFFLTLSSFFWLVISFIL